MPGAATSEVEVSFSLIIINPAVPDVDLSYEAGGNAGAVSLLGGAANLSFYQLQSRRRDYRDTTRARRYAMNPHHNHNP